MATLPPATTIGSSFLDEAVSRFPSFSGEVLSLRNLSKHRLPISHSKQNAPFPLCGRSSMQRISATAAPAPQTTMPLGTVIGEEEYSDDEVELASAAAEGTWFDWNSQWYPVSMINDLDRRVPTAITIIGRHLVVSWDPTRQSWQVWDEATPLTDAQLRGEGNSRSSPVLGSLKRSSQNDYSSIYPSVEQDGLLWFWPDTRSEFENIAARRPPPVIPALTDPAFKDKLYSMNLPYGYKKMIENLLEPAYLPFAHDEPQVDLLEDFEKRLSSTASRSSTKFGTARPYKEKQQRQSNGHAENLGLKCPKAVKNGSAKAKFEFSYLAEQNGASGRSTSIYSEANSSSNAVVELSHEDVSSIDHTNVFGKTNGSATAKMEIVSDVKQYGTLDGSTDIHSKIDANETKAESYTSNTAETVKVGTDNAKVPSAYAAPQKDADGSSKKASWESLVQSTEDGLQSGEVLSPNLPRESVREGESVKEGEVNRIELASRSSTSRAEADVSQLSLVLKKPKTKLEEKVGGTADFSNMYRLKTEGRDVIVNGSNGSCLDLTTSLQTLRRLIFQKEYKLAKGRVQELYEKYPNDTCVLMEYAFVEKQLGDLVAAGSLYSKAISAFEHQQNLGYDYVRALQALGSIESRARNAKRARVLFMESIRAARQAEHHFPDLVCGASVYGLHAWAQLELQQGNWAKARDLLTRAADIQPGNAVVHQSRALLEAKAHNWEEARYHFSLAVESAPNDVKCWHAWAIFEASQGKENKMRELFQRALEVDPDSIHCLQAWAHQETLFATPESKDKARFLFQRCTEIQPKSLYAWQAWAVLEQTSGNYVKARVLFEKCLEINPSSVASLQAFANMERHLEKWSAAQRLLRKALKLEPENAAVLMEAAFVENSLGNTEEADRLFVLAGMADKRTSRVTNKIFASRKEVMPRGVDSAFRRSEHQKLSTKIKATEDAFKLSREELNTNIVTGRKSYPFKAVVKAAKTKQEKFKRHSIRQKYPSSSSLYRDGNKLTNRHVVPEVVQAKRREGTKKPERVERPSSNLNLKERKPANFQVAIIAMKSKQTELRKIGGLISGLKRPGIKSNPEFQTAINGIEAKLRELNTKSEMEKQLSSSAKQAECAPSMI